jgi:hypothetical protein
MRQFVLHVFFPNAEFTINLPGLFITLRRFRRVFVLLHVSFMYLFKVFFSNADFTINLHILFITLFRFMRVCCTCQLGIC